MQAKTEPLMALATEMTGDDTGAGLWRAFHFSKPESHTEFYGSASTYSGYWDCHCIVIKGATDPLQPQDYGGATENASS